jgi:hypothetical protein
MSNQARVIGVALAGLVLWVVLQGGVPHAAGPPPLDIPNRTWVSRPLPDGKRAPGSSKHTRLIYDSRRGRMVLTGGDYSTPPIPHDGSQMVWAMDLASGLAPAWTLIGPWCNGPVQPGRPDTVTWIYDSKRDRGIVMPGFYFITQNSSSQCDGVTDSADAMIFDFSTNKWRLPSWGPPPDGYGGDLGSSFGVYDPVSDAVYRFRWQGRTVIEVLSLQTNRWDVGGVGSAFEGTDASRDQSVIDVQGRSIYVISRPLRALIRYSIPKRRVAEVIALPREARPPEGTEDGWETYLVFDPINRVVLYPNTRDNGGRVHGLGIYHVDVKRWEWELPPATGHPVQGNSVGFDVGNNVMLLYGGKGADDIDEPSVFWLYRYGRAGTAPEAPTRR